MAKSNNLITKGLSGTIDNLTFVDSIAYGEHTRSRRGTFKPAVLNAAMLQSKERLLRVNEIASLIFRSIFEHKDGKLWTRLLSTLRRQLKETGHNDVLCLLDLECDAEHPLEKMLRSQWNVAGEIVQRKMKLTLTLPEPPVGDKKQLKEFQASMHVIFPDFDRKKLKKETAYSDVLYKTSCPQELSFEIPVPAKSSMVAVFLKVTECKDGMALNYPKTTGMRCVAVDIIPGREGKPAKRKAAPKEKQAVAKPKSGAVRKTSKTVGKKKKK